jgi:ABC-type glutathione transport system ATPase component
VVANDDPTADQKLVTGDAVNVTARLEQAAPENQIYLGDSTYRLVRDAVEVESVEPLELKGKAERVPAYRLVSVRGLDGYARRENSPIVGREEELAAVGEALEEAAKTRSARLVTIIGDAGMGKSRLAREVIAQASSRAGARVVRGRCLNYGEGITFLAAARHRRRRRRHPLRRQPGRGTREARRHRRRRRRRGAPGRRHRPQRCNLPAARVQLGGAQIPRDACQVTDRWSR